MALDTSPRLDDPDGLFAALVEAHDGLGPAASRQLDAQLVLLLANHIGSTATVLDALRIARAALPPDAPADAAPNARSHSSPGPHASTHTGAHGVSTRADTPIGTHASARTPARTHPRQPTTQETAR